MNELRVLTGLHRGIAIPMDANRLQIGSGFESDLVLADQGIVETHAVIVSNERLPVNCWNLEVGSENIWTPENRRVPSGHVMKKGKALNMGGVWLIIMDSSEAWPEGEAFRSPKKISHKNADKVASSSSWPIKLVGAGLCVLLGTVALSFGSEDENHIEESMFLGGGLDFSEAPIEELGDAADVQDPIAKDQLLHDFRRMLKERGLYGLSVIANDSGVEVSGTLEDDEIEVLNRTINRYKSKMSEKISIQNLVAPIERDLPFGIVKVISGPYGFIESDDGIKLSIGDSYKGFKLVAIDHTALRFEGPTNLTLKW